MKLTEIYNKKKQVLSFEIFPPKKDEDFENIDELLEILCELNPDYISVTFGAGGSSNRNRTIEIAKKIIGLVPLFIGAFIGIFPMLYTSICTSIICYPILLSRN